MKQLDLLATASFLLVSPKNPSVFLPRVKFLLDVPSMMWEARTASVAQFQHADAFALSIAGVVFDVANAPKVHLGVSGYPPAMVMGQP